jgi:diguanylate cyclase (GGDEF)-like protein/PAS domain S-box-containing protein
MSKPPSDSNTRKPAVPAETAEARLQRLEKALDTMQVGVTITDAERRILYVNRAEAEMHGYSKEELFGEKASIFAPKRLHAKPIPPPQLKTICSWQRESVNIRKDGSTYPVEILSDLVTDSQGEPIGIVSISRDITEKKEWEEALRTSEERYALALRGANDGIWDWDLRSDRMVFSDRWKEMLGFEKHQISGDPVEWFSRVHPEDVDRLQRDLDNHLAGLTEHFRNEHRMLHASGDYRWMLSRGLAVRAEGEGPSRIAGSQTDITDRKVHDPLTGLPNRALFLDRLEGALRRARRHRGTLAVMFLDLDRFKLINDSLGHQAGDQLLTRVARTLESCLRPEDTVARMGGDEFTILLERVNEIDDVVAVADRIRRELGDPIRISDQDVFTSASIGITMSTTGREDPGELLRDADTAMYQAKARSAGRYQIFDSEMRQQAIKQLDLETDMRRALDNDEFRLFYQPIINLTSAEISGFEALIRWRHPTRGLLTPSDFIPTAEETGFILRIGRWVLREACKQLRLWHQEFPGTQSLKMSVNLSPKQFAHPKLIKQIREALDESGLSPNSLQIEITESAFINNVDDAIEMVNMLREMGIMVAIDDFGTGYSSLSFLDRFPIDILKIDRSFVSKIDLGEKQHELVETMIEMADKLGIEVVAEGVETQGQRQRLEDLSCAFMQGFSFSAPAPPEEIRLRFLHRD